MEWLDQLNDALDYMEQNLQGEIDYHQAAKLACCSVFHFQRMFSYIAGVPLSEYIRRRRMTAAAFDLQNGERVLDVALKYGYNSPTSFNRAFQSIHGISPSTAQKQGVGLKAFPRISFKITIKGEAEMDYRIEKKEAFRVVGVKTPMEKDVEKNFTTIPQFWQQVSEQGKIPQLCELMNSQPMGIMGLSACMDADENWEYYIAVSSNKKAVEGLSEYTIPAKTWAIFSGEGAMPLAIQELEKRIITEWLPTSGYEYADAPDIELYLNADPANAKFEVWVPVQKKAKN
ncbi:AraC family transcriptional regulator [Hydrogenoanaerobacterium saccharovorans]|uniref:Transcriptional regulator, AraC family n=1 Tax=Hydrogenoanaerobacterium saccharovorans TaxID=474960 RepID=A0A1H8E8I8_9FIRM|nr:AraC family transcriptional regulator [Hydrogenoanaerobacterium saccharovorans]RPF41945.1 AraC family transcriptional regulator [Hydrogenoanaerobacterium saccharovorans]SEN15710.1 transcriptional regulator, AraC family [Hydrogenoanaerobacterium saccharovorans]